MKVLPATEENIKEASDIVRTGGVVIYPTETVYGLGCAPQINDAARRVCEIKGRADKPLPIACSSITVAHRLSTIKNVDRIYVMDGGRMAMSGTTREVFSQPEKLREHGLGVPQVTEVAHALIARGIAVEQIPRGSSLKIEPV